MTDPASQAPASAKPAHVLDWRRLWRSPSAWFLFAANLVPLYGVLLHGWPVLPVIVLFWLENVIIGVLNVARILLAGAGGAMSGRLLVAAFFCVHYGLFTAGHGLFVFSLFGGETYRALVHGLWTIDAARLAINEFALWLPLAALALSHLFSMLWNYLYQGEYRRADTKTLMHAPYGRIVVLHLALIGGGFLVQTLHSPVLGLVLLIALKIGLDLRAHLQEHAHKDAALRADR